MSRAEDRPLELSRARAIVAAVVATGASVFLLGVSALATALTCGDDGSVDYGTAGAAARRLCRASASDVDRVYAAALMGVVVVGTLLAITRRRWLLTVELILLALLGAWVLGHILFVS